MILSCQKLSKSFAEDVILNEVSFGIEAHEKTAVVGANGAGKSTLLKIITGELAPDDGEIVFARGLRMGYLAQQGMLLDDRTILEELKDAKREIFAAQRQLRTLSQKISDASKTELDELMQQYHTLNEWFERQDGYAAESEVNGVLKGLGFSREDGERTTKTLSGGQKTRVALGKLLLSSPDLILLDEPTNHLDISSIEWLEGYLRSYKGAAIIVSHDRYFLNRIVTKVVEIEQGTAGVYQGDYAAFAAKKKQLREAALKAYLKQQAQIKHQEQVIEKLRSFNREKSIRRAESREKLLERTKVLDKPVEAQEHIRFSLSPAVESGKDVLQAEHLAKSYAHPLFRDLSFQIRKGERVALIGSNGTGKTTLLRIINGMIPADAGTVTFGSHVLIGYYDQDHQVLHPEKTLFEEISDTYPDMTQTQIRNVLAAFLFTGDDVYKRICDISGGERGRVSLAKLMLSNANFLILDEPTNHLDIQSKEILEDALRLYTGTVLYVSHDRYFVNRTCTRILDLKNTVLIPYEGNYDYYLEKCEEQTAIHTARGEQSAAACALPSAADADHQRGKEAWRQSKQAQALERKQRNDLKRTEEAIARLEEEDRQLDEALLQEETFTDPEKAARLTTKKAELSKQLEDLYEEWETLASALS